MNDDLMTLPLERMFGSFAVPLHLVESARNHLALDSWTTLAISAVGLWIYGSLAARSLSKDIPDEDRHP